MIRLTDLQGMTILAAADGRQAQLVRAADCLDSTVVDPATPAGRIISAMCGGTGMMAATQGDLTWLLPIRMLDTTRDPIRVIGEDRLLPDKAEAMPIEPPAPQYPPQAEEEERTAAATQAAETGRRMASKRQVLELIRQRAENRVARQEDAQQSGEETARAAVRDRRTRDAMMMERNH
ncbi:MULTISPECIES: hypothetical protein [Bifidobacterium]|uniref:Uncharacterized protein n=2 Tax=Bifidobacterium TaxID=1678 RepID=A0A261FTF7_9BIFI|nr:MULTISPECIES: hypothetical protein [Bifidobacterium]OZG62481.1 hypothetical protein BLEM_1027 [Bifidobacterium lemurum]OZG69017.1 hypothetical protein BEUL_0423 [Bifidobacterium eulemuris]QOL31454.1 hypothetical protein BE0216_02515 [Bifidobacterium eulemuris]QOL33823.1 hypothetical protein BL8807_08565 [Bifidobacterium lemurum]